MALLFFWTYFYTFRPEINREYVPSATPPHYQVSVCCNSKHREIWFLVTYLYSGILVILVMFLATQTRHIKKEHFKDTKKVNLFIFHGHNYSCNNPSSLDYFWCYWYRDWSTRVSAVPFYSKVIAPGSKENHMYM